MAQTQLNENSKSCEFYEVDVVIPVHSPSRPISRAVNSVLQHTQSKVRVNVIAHNINKEIIVNNLGDLILDSRVRLLHLVDEIPSPAGPMNLGLEQSTAEYVAVMGSDDEFAPGAIDSWLSVQKVCDSDFVIAQIRNVGGGLVPSPPTRPRRTLNLDPVKDRLSYRSAPLGLLKKTAFPNLRFSEGLASGEDLPFVTELWFLGKNIAFDRTGPEYLVHADAEDRVTSAPRPVSEDFAFLDLIIDADWSKEFTQKQKQAIAIKMIRGHLFDAIVNRANQGISESELTELSKIAKKLSHWGGRPEKLLSILDRKVFDALLHQSGTIEEMMSNIVKRWNYKSFDVVATKNPFYIFHRQGPLRTYIGGYFI